MSDFDDVQEAAAVIRVRVREVPRVAVVLGSGLGDFAGGLGNSVSVPYAELPHWPASRVEGHEGRLVVGRLNSRGVATLSGRSHA